MDYAGHGSRLLSPVLAVGLPCRESFPSTLQPSPVDIGGRLIFDFVSKVGFRLGVLVSHALTFPSFDMVSYLRGLDRVPCAVCVRVCHVACILSE